MTTTPAKPMSTPTTRAGVMRSSSVKRWATMTVKNGVVALRIEASPPAIWVWPQAMRLKGTTLLRTPIAAKAAHMRRSPGTRRPVARTTRKSIAAPRLTRTATMVSGGRAVTAMAMKKNEPPHSIDRAMSRPHSVAVMVRLMAGGTARLG